MPFYELVLVCRMGESSALATALKRITSGILQEGGVVRNINNIGDRVLTKNLTSKDGINYGVGRYIQVSAEEAYVFFRWNSTLTTRPGLWQKSWL